MDGKRFVLPDAPVRCRFFGHFFETAGCPREMRVEPLLIFRSLLSYHMNAAGNLQRDGR
jgi:hypothetical protein